MTPYPVVVDVTRPERSSRVHVAVRLLLLATLSLLGLSLGLVFMALYLLLPAIAAAALADKGPGRFFAEDAPRLERAIRRVVAAWAYLGMLTDRAFDAEPPVRFEVRFAGTPTARDALLRIVTSLPSALAFAVIAVASWVVWVVSAFFVVVFGRVPDAMFDFQVGVARWLGRLLAYHAALVDTYPPFALDLGPSSSSPITPAGAAT